jgi:hypothetical protein
MPPYWASATLAALLQLLELPPPPLATGDSNKFKQLRTRGKGEKIYSDWTESAQETLEGDSWQ